MYPDHVDEPFNVKGVASRIQRAEVVTVNPDATVDAKTLGRRSVKVSLFVPGWYLPRVGDRVLVADVDGDPQRPIILQYLGNQAGQSVAPTIQVAQPTWTAPTLGNSWANVAGQPSGYLKDALGFVHLRGAVQTGATNTTAFTLPAGFRPGQSVVAAVWSSGASNNGNVIVTAAGVVTPLYGTSGTTVGLDGISFLAEN